MLLTRMRQRPIRLWRWSLEPMLGVFPRSRWMMDLIRRRKGWTKARHQHQTSSQLPSLNQMQSESQHQNLSQQKSQHRRQYVMLHPSQSLCQRRLLHLPPNQLPSRHLSPHPLLLLNR